MDYYINLAPEIFQFVFIGAIFFVSVLNRNDIKWIPLGALLGVIACGISLDAEGLYFYSAYRVDGLSQFYKLIISLGFFIVSLNAQAPATISDEKRVDYFLMLAISSFALMLLSSAVELITIILCLEISSFSLYALVPLRAKSKEAAEAGIKYILFGASSGAFALLGYSFVLASAHTSYLDLLKAPLTNGPVMGIFGMGLFISIMFFKLALVPFHFWAPDIYEGAGNKTAALIATLPKLGAMAVLIRIAHMLPGTGLSTIIAVLAAFSITYGNVAALVQKDVKRILGYSGIAHAGYIMIGIVAGSKEGLAAAAFYSLAYMLMNLACFWVLCRISPKGENVTLEGLSGLYKTAPVQAFVLAVGAFALVGLPPFAGFSGKLFLLTSAWITGHHWLVMVAAVNTALSIFYYLNLVRYAYTAEAQGERAVDKTFGLGAFSLVLALSLIVLGVAPSWVYDTALKAVTGLVP